MHLDMGHFLFCTILRWTDGFTLVMCAVILSSTSGMFKSPLASKPTLDPFFKPFHFLRNLIHALVGRCSSITSCSHFIFCLDLKSIRGSTINVNPPGTQCSIITSSSKPTTRIIISPSPSSSSPEKVRQPHPPSSAHIN
ncbi:hypothetical protein ATANTOWER_013660 [Ataeniobius toweri]|uniref:Uncharacterized protein n=1 Tax=Ataeniobius toweri TaxID=208326 RepID=A0ABU7A6J7_9TELE|nr:hypothetical protein [Ataeniobius toweri]